MRMTMLANLVSTMQTKLSIFKPGAHKHASGQSHAEIVAAAVNAVLMLVVVAYIVYEALQRFDNPHPLISGYVMLIAFAGLVVNIIVAKMLHGNHAHDHNKCAAKARL